MAGFCKHCGNYYDGYLCNGACPHCNSTSTGEIVFGIGITIAVLICIAISIWETHPNYVLASAGILGLLLMGIEFKFARILGFVISMTAGITYVCLS